MVRGLQELLDELERDRSLNEPERLRDRIEALDRLDSYLAEEESPNVEELSVDAGGSFRAQNFYAHFEAANLALYQAIRTRIQNGDGIGSLQRWLPNGAMQSTGRMKPARGLGYDYLDELISGVLQFPAPEIRSVQLEPDMVFYQPTPARHIFDLIGLTNLTKQDVLIDLGSGLGHVPLLVSICTNARCVGIEFQAGYVACSRYAARQLNLNAKFLQQDVRAADLSGGTVFYLYTPFTGSMLRDVLGRLRLEGMRREIRICTFGPCTATIAEEPWLRALGTSEEGRIAVFCSRD